MTWFPTIVFMEYLLPRNMGWSKAFFDTAEGASPEGRLTNMAKWYTMLCKKTQWSDSFGKVRDEIWGFWAKKDTEGQFNDIREEVLDTSYKWVYP